MIRALRWIALIGVGALLTAALVGGEAPEEHFANSQEEEIAEEAVGIIGGLRYPWDVNDIKFWSDVVEHLIAEHHDLQSVVYFLQEELDHATREREKNNDG